MAMQRAPDWEKNAILPLEGIPGAKVALRREDVSISPKQLGPRIRIFISFAFINISLSILAPADPVSLKPADIAIMESIFFFLQSSRVLRMNRGGII